jgi:hypothetical protein
MGINPFKLQQHRSQLQRTPRHGYTADFLDRYAVSDCVGNGLIPADGFGDFNASLRGFSLSKFFEPSVLVEKADLEIEDGFAYDAKAEVPRLDYTCVDWPDWYLIDAFTFDLLEDILVFTARLYLGDFAVFEGL